MLNWRRSYGQHRPAYLNRGIYLNYVDTTKHAVVVVGHKTTIILIYEIRSVRRVVFLNTGRLSQVSSEGTLAYNIRQFWKKNDGPELGSELEFWCKI